MSYAGSSTRRSRWALRGAVQPPPPSAPEHRPRGLPSLPRPEVDWEQVAIFATGLTLGLVAGAGAALLLAPASGQQTRRSIARAGRRVRRRGHDAWDDLRDELRRAARRGRKAVRRTFDERRQERAAARAAARAARLADVED